MKICFAKPAVGYCAKTKCLHTQRADATRAKTKALTQLGRYMINDIVR